MGRVERLKRNVPNAGGRVERLKRKVPHVVGRVERLKRKAPKIRNVWNGMFQRFTTFGTVRSKGCQRLERYVPKVANV